MQEDGGYGWMVVMATFFSCFFGLGTFKSFSLFLAPIQQSLDTSVVVMGTAFALVHTICYVLAPVGGRVGVGARCRPYAMVGGLVCAGGLLILSVAQNLTTFYIGIIATGTAYGFSYTPLVVSVAAYFPTRYALANAVFSSGAAIGMMVIPPLADLLIQTYGWRWAMALIAALNFHITACAALVRPLPQRYERLTPDGCSASPTTTTDTERSPRTWAGRLLGFLRALPERLSLDLVAEAPVICIYLLVFLLVGAMYSAWFLYLIPHAEARGIDTRRASFLATAGGLGNLAVRMLHGPLIDRGHVTAVGCFLLLFAVNAAAFFLDHFSSDVYALHILLAVLNGGALGTMCILALPVAQELLEKSLSMKGYLLLMPFFAFGEASGGALGGFLYQISGNCDQAFLVLGGLSVFSGALVTAERLFNRSRQTST